MWPKVIAQLFELLPHVSRLIPLADRFLSSKAASEKANETALAAMAEGVRGDLGQVTKAHAGLYRQLQDQSAQITEVGQEVKLVAAAVAKRDQHLETLELQLKTLATWVKAGVSLLVVLLILVIWLLVQFAHAH
ncbi:MAG TPA: hypothetical protein VK627_09445 [Edaphobacter sp.]|jgi:ABC-type transporter Mla subunit MlaD|nr:hypothetical protein [Edaphobacter sp.]